MSEQAVNDWIKQMSTRMKRRLAADVRAEADRLAAAIKSAAPRGETGALADSVNVRRGRNTLELVVEAGGSATTRFYDRGGVGYQREIKVGQGRYDRVPRGSQGVSYDYSLGVEFGNEHAPAQPFFYPTYRAMRPEIEANLREAVERAMGEL